MSGASAVTAPDTMILCGGQGTRLRGVVADRPKGLAIVAGRAFLDILVEELERHDLRRFILCTGHGSADIEAHFSDRSDAEFLISAESEPLGTAGGVRNALGLLRTDPFIILNGDSICVVDYGALVEYHRRAGALITMVVASDPARADAGNVVLEPDGRLRSFREKARTSTSGPGFVNAGIYVAQRSVMARLEPGIAASLEHDVIPAVVREGRCYGFAVSSVLTDIGTPERYHAAQKALGRS